MTNCVMTGMAMTGMVESSRRLILYVEPEQQDLAVLDDVVLPLSPHLAGVLRPQLTLAGDEVVARSFRKR